VSDNVPARRLAGSRPSSFANYVAEENHQPPLVVCWLVQALAAQTSGHRINALLCLFFIYGVANSPVKRAVAHYRWAFAHRGGLLSTPCSGILLARKRGAAHLLLHAISS